MGYVDYTQGTGNGGTMLIRVADAAGQSGVINGNDIQFHIQAGLSATFTNALKWKHYINGAWTDPAGSVNYSTGRPWVYLASHNITSTQDVCFGLLATGTQGLGGPTDFWLRVNRGGPPGAPSNLRLEPGTLKHQSFGVRYTRGGTTGGAAITADIVEWATDSGFTNIVWQDGTGAPGNGPAGLSNPAGAGLPNLLKPGTKYYIRAKSDAYGFGWSGWSSTFSQTTLAGAKLKVSGAWVDAVPYVKVSGAWVPAVSYVKVAGVWVPTA